MADLYLPILDIPRDAEELLLGHRLGGDEQELARALEEVAPEAPFPEVRRALVPIGAGFGLGPARTVAFWVRAHYRLFEPLPAGATDDVPAELHTFAHRILDHSFASIRASGRLRPFVLVDGSDGRREVRRFERDEEGVAEGRAWVAGRALELESYVLVWQGIAAFEGERWSALLCEAGAASAGRGILLCQRYRARRDLSLRRSRLRVGKPGVVELPPSRIFRGG